MRVAGVKINLSTVHRGEVAPSQALPHARLHDLRHLHATTLQVSGIASDASFGAPGERVLPGLQREGLPWGRLPE
jgi:hypothetical protein